MRGNDTVESSHSWSIAPPWKGGGFRPTGVRIPHSPNYVYMKGKSKASTPTEYINELKGERKAFIKKMHAFIRKTVPSLKPHMNYGMIGYGAFHYTYASGREGDWMVIALASQKNYVSVYVCLCDGSGYIPEKYKKKLGKVSVGKSCIRIKKPEDIDMNVLKIVLMEAEKTYKKQYSS